MGVSRLGGQALPEHRRHGRQGRRREGLVGGDDRRRHRGRRGGRRCRPPDRADGGDGGRSRSRGAGEGGDTGDRPPGTALRHRPRRERTLRAPGRQGQSALWGRGPRMDRRGPDRRAQQAQYPPHQEYRQAARRAASGSGGRTCNPKLGRRGGTGPGLSAHHRRPGQPRQLRGRHRVCPRIRHLTRDGQGRQRPGAARRVERRHQRAWAGPIRRRQPGSGARSAAGFRPPSGTDVCARRGSDLAPSGGQCNHFQDFMAGNRADELLRFSSKLSNDGTGTRKFRRAYPTSPSTLPLPGRPYRSSNR